MSAPLIGELFAVAALLMFSVNIILTKVASTKTSLSLGFLVSVSVNVIVGALLFGVELVLRKDALHWNGAAFGTFLLAGVFATFLGRWFFFESVVHFGPAKASAFQISSPLFTAIIAWIFFGQTLRATDLAGMALVVLGLLLVANIGEVFRQRSASKAARSAATAAGAPAPAGLQFKALLRSGAVLGIGGSMAYAIGHVLRGAAVLSWNEPILGTLLGACSGITLHMLFSGGTRDMVRDIRAADRQGVLLFTIGGLLTILSQISMVVSLRYIPVSITALISLCTPALVFPMSYFFLKNQERITWTPMLGCALTLAGIVVIVLR
jgi:drug/metabolite transporter (DMT)-like permease